MTCQTHQWEIIAVTPAEIIVVDDKPVVFPTGETYETTGCSVCFASVDEIFPILT